MRACSCPVLLPKQTKRKETKTKTKKKLDKLIKKKDSSKVRLRILIEILALNNNHKYLTKLTRNTI